MFKKLLQRTFAGSYLFKDRIISFFLSHKIITISSLFVFGICSSCLFSYTYNDNLNKNFMISHKKELKISIEEFNRKIQSHYSRRLLTIQRILSKLGDIGDERMIDITYSLLNDVICDIFFWYDGQSMDINLNQSIIDSTKLNIIKNAISLDIERAQYPYHKVIISKIFSYDDEAYPTKIALLQSSSYLGKEGLLICILDIEKFLQQVQKNNPNVKNPEIYLIDRTNGINNLIYSSSHKTKIHYEDLVKNPAEIFYNAKLNIFDNEWQSSIKSDLNIFYITKNIFIYLDHNLYWLPILLLIIGFAFTIFLTLFTSILINRNTKNDSLIKNNQRILGELNYKVHHNQKEIEAILSTIVDGIILFSYKGIIITTNQTVSNIFGYHKNEIIGKYIGDFLKCDQDFFSLIVNDNFLYNASEVVKRLKLECNKKNGDVIYVEISMNNNCTIKANEAVYVITIRDITEQENIKNEILERSSYLENERQKFESASIEKSHFLANMSHEIRTPVNSIIGTSELLLCTSLNAVQEEYLTNINIGCNLLLEIINDVLDLSKIESGIVTINSQPAHLTEIVKEVLLLLYHNTESFPCNIYVRYDPAINTEIIVDATKLKQILINLIKNAISNTQHSNSSEMKIFINIQPYKESTSHIHFEIMDNGLGIAEEDITRIFNRFTQAKNNLTQQNGNYGLGLAICKKLIQIMEGEIYVKSMVDYGSIFWFYIKSQIIEKTLELKNTKDTHVLIIDDQNINNVIVSEYLFYYNIKHDIAISRKKAMHLLLLKGNYDYIFVSENLQNDHWEKIGQDIRMIHNNNRNAKLLLMTNFKITNTLNLTLLYNYYDSYLSRPFLAEDLYNIVTTNDFPLKNNKENFCSNHDQMNHDIDILVIDDYAPNQKIVKKILEKYGCKVTAVDEGKKAITYIEKYNYDLIFMDCYMPNMDGYETTSIIRKMEKKYNIIVAMTANALNGDEEKCLRCGMDDYVSKPIKQQSLEKILHKWCQNQFCKEKVET